MSFHITSENIQNIGGDYSLGSYKKELAAREVPVMLITRKSEFIPISYLYALIIRNVPIIPWIGYSRTLAYRIQRVEDTFYSDYPRRFKRSVKTKNTFLSLSAYISNGHIIHLIKSEFPPYEKYYAPSLVIGIKSKDANLYTNYSIPTSKAICYVAAEFIESKSYDSSLRKLVNTKIYPKLISNNVKIEKLPFREIVKKLSFEPIAGDYYNTKNINSKLLKYVKSNYSNP